MKMHESIPNHFEEETHADAREQLGKLAVSTEIHFVPQPKREVHPLDSDMLRWHYKIQQELAEGYEPNYGPDYEY